MQDKKLSTIVDLLEKITTDRSVPKNIRAQERKSIRIYWLMACALVTYALIKA